jgi:hypothetical protein
LRQFSTLVASLGLCAIPASAGDDQHNWLAGEAITKALAGKTIEGSYASGRAFSERYNLDGKVQYAEGGQTMGGHWSVTSGTLCTIYETDPTGGCFRVAKVGANCFEFYFAARTEESAPGPADGKPKWTARGSVPGEGGACQDGADV